MSTPAAGRLPTVVVVPGLGLDARSWSGVWPHLRPGSTVVTLPAMGIPLRAPLSAEGSAALLTDLLPRTPVVLVGHSGSCQVVVEAARRDPRVVGLVIVGPTTDPAVRAWPRLVSTWLATARHEEPWEPRVLTPQYRRTRVRSILWAMHHLRDHRVDLALADVTVPTAVVRGEHDHIAGADWCAELARRSGGEAVTVVGAGHMVPLTHPRELAAVVEDVRERAVSRRALG